MNLGDQPIFPGQPVLENGEFRYGGGITLRHVFAGLAMQSFIASTPDADGSKEFILASSVEFADGLAAKLQEKGERA